MLLSYTEQLYLDRKNTVRFNVPKLLNCEGLMANIYTGNKLINLVKALCI